MSNAFENLVPGYTAHFYEKDNQWYHDGILLIDPIVTIHHIGTDPYTDERYIVHIIHGGNILGTGTTY